MNTSLLPGVSGSLQAAPTTPTSEAPQGPADIINLANVFCETPEASPGEVPPVAADSAVTAVVQELEHQPATRIPGEVIAEAVPGGRVPKPVGQPGVAARAASAAKIHTLRALSSMKVKIVGTWERIPSQESLFTRTIVAMAVILMVTGAFSAWSGVTLLDRVKETRALTTALEDTTRVMNAQGAKLAEVSRQLEAANRELNATPWWKFWANW